LRALQKSGVSIVLCTGTPGHLDWLQGDVSVLFAGTELWRTTASDLERRLEAGSTASTALITLDLTTLEPAQSLLEALAGQPHVVSAVALDSNRVRCTIRGSAQTQAELVHRAVDAGLSLVGVERTRGGYEGLVAELTGRPHVD
jgi:hypothetical protein